MLGREPPTHHGTRATYPPWCICHPPTSPGTPWTLRGVPHCCRGALLSRFPTLTRAVTELNISDDGFTVTQSYYSPVSLLVDVEEAGHDAQSPLDSFGREAGMLRRQLSHHPPVSLFGTHPYVLSFSTLVRNEEIRRV